MAKMPAGLRRYWANRRGKRKEYTRKEYTIRGSHSTKLRGGMYKSSHRKKSFTLPLAVVAGFMPLAVDVGTQLKAGAWSQAGNVMTHNLTGYNPWSGKMDTQGFSHGLYPILAGFGVHKLASMVGLNRLIARSGIPFLRI